MQPIFRHATLTAASTLLASAFTLLSVASTHAADPYDQSLEARVEALERELNVTASDAKGKNVRDTSTEVPTFLKAGGKNVKELVITGEFRLRYEYDNVDGQTTTAATQNSEGQTSRERFRLRLFADYKLDDHLYAGVAAQTNVASDSGNTTFSEGFDNYSLYLWRVFVGWKPNENITLVGGKIPNPFYSNTELLFDADISPTGLAQKFTFPITKAFALTLNAGEFIFYDNNENAERNPTTLANGVTANPANVKGGNNNTDAYLLYGQLMATFKASDKLALTGAAGFLTYVDNGGLNSPAAVTVGTNGFGAGNANGQAGNVLQNTAAFNSANATRNLFLGTFSGDVKFTFGAFKIKPYADAVYNFRGGARDFEEYGLPLYSTVDKVAFATGVAVGSDFSLKKTGDYLILAEYRQVGLGSEDPNLNDSDFNASRLGFRGFKGAINYAFRPWLIGTVTGYFGSNLGHEKNVNIAVDNFNATQTVQVDLTTLF